MIATFPAEGQHGNVESKNMDQRVRIPCWETISDEFWGIAQLPITVYVTE